MLDVRCWMLVGGRRFAPAFLVLTNIQHPTSALGLPADQLRLGHLFDGVLGALAAAAAELDAPVGHLIHAVLRYLIDHKAPYVDAMGRVEGLVNIAGIDA